MFSEMPLWDGTEDIWKRLECSGIMTEQELKVYSTGDSIGEHKLFLAVDSRGARHLLIPIQKEAFLKEDTRSQGVQIRRRDLKDEKKLIPFIDIACLLPELNETFTFLLYDILSEIRTETELPEILCGRVLNKWRSLLERNQQRVLNENLITGLYGELCYLRELVRITPEALSTWKGPLKEKHDFYSRNIFLEIKTSLSRQGRVCEIHGHDQLETDEGNSLYLAYIALERNPHGEILPEIISEIHSLGVHKSEFTRLLLEYGYNAADHEFYETFRFKVREQFLYQVNETFPRITSVSFKEGRLPFGIIKIDYVIDLTNQPPVPLSEEQSKRIIHNFALGGADH